MSACEKAIPLLAWARMPNTRGFGLQKWGVELGPCSHVGVDAGLRTHFPNTLVGGDVAGPCQFIHGAVRQAWSWR